MKVPIICFALIAIILLLTTSTSAKFEIPPCIEKMINSILEQPVTNPPTKISRFLYRGKLTYVASSSYWDQFIPLYDGVCNYICAPFGGFSGLGDGKCTDFDTTATSLGAVWVDPRSRD